MSVPDTRPVSWAPYMEWAKKRPPVAYDLAGSNLLGCTVDDLPGCRDVVELGGLSPDGYPPLLEAIAARYGVTAAQVAPASGAGGANFLAMAALVRPGDEVLVERPAYDPLLGALRVLDASVRRFDRTFEDGWAVDADRVGAAITDRTRLIVFTSPHNPSGVLATTEALQEIGRAAARVGAHVLVDEVYLDALYATQRHPPAATLGDSFISINSLTKAYGLSGLRAGWILASPAVAEAVRRTRDVMEGIGAFPAERLAWYAFQQIDRLEARARALLEPNLRTLTRFIEARSELDWVPPSGGNVAFPLVRGLADTREFAEQLQRERDTAVVPGFFFDSPPHIRVAFSCSAETLQGGVARLGAALDALHA